MKQILYIIVCLSAFLLPFAGKAQQPEPYMRGATGSMTLWVSSADPYYGIYAWDYDTDTEPWQYDGSWKTYPTIRIGEYEVTSRNLLLHYRDKWSVALSWMNFSDDIINQMNREFQGSDNVDRLTFQDINGSYVSLYNEALSYRDAFKVYKADRTTEIPGWNLLGSTELFQMFGLAPKISSDPFTDIMNFLGANQSDMPAGYTADWFGYQNTSGFTMTPLGRRHSNYDGENGQKWFGYKVECGLRLRDYPAGMILFNRSQGIQIVPNLYHLCQARYSRALTDEELGYKMYVDNCNDAVVMYPLNKVTQLTELPKGLERGIALRYADHDEMKVYRKWSEIRTEADDIRRAIPAIPAPEPLAESPCEEEEEPDEICPDPYVKGAEGSMTLWVSSAAPYYGIYAWDYDNDTELWQYDGSWKTYPTVQIGEYEVTARNLLLHYRDKWGTALGWMNFSDDIINQMNQEFQGSGNVSRLRFQDINGSYVSLYNEALSYRDAFKVYESNRSVEIPGWDLLGSVELLQMFGQAPAESGDPFTNVMNFLGANRNDFPDYPADWFEYKNTSGFTMTPLGRRHSNYDGENGQKWFGYKIECGLRLKDYPAGMILFNRSQGVQIAPNLYHLCQARYSRTRTDAELGYKMYIDAAADRVLILPYSEVSALPELPRGLERGVALRYSNRSRMTVLKKWSEIQAEAALIYRSLIEKSGETVPVGDGCENQGGGEEPGPEPAERTPGNPSLAQNFIRTLTYTEETATEDDTKALDRIEYFDGLGRSVQLVQRQFTPQGYDLSALTEYDDSGRESSSWLPVVSSANGGYTESDAFKGLSTATYTGESRPFARPVYEASPLNRVTEQYGPGQEWVNAPVATAYKTNTASGELACIRYTVGGTRNNPGLSKEGMYNPGELYVTEMKDELGNTAYEFKDKLGLTVLTRRKGEAGELLDTYYVHDDFANRCFVLPPQAAGSVDAGVIDKYAYRYKYDDRNRCIAKKLPGADWVQFVYDKADRIILTQDGEQNDRNEWTYNKYDVFGRVVISGVCTVTGQDAEALRNKYKGLLIVEQPAPGYYGYTWNTLPEAFYTGALLINHYDDYNHLLSQSSDFANRYKYVARVGFGERHTDPNLGDKTPKGQLTGTRVKYTDAGGQVTGEVVSAFYYDNRGRLIQTQSDNILGGTDSEYIAYNFGGQPLKRETVHTVPQKEQVTELYTYIYDHAERPVRVSHSLNGRTEVSLAANAYDEFGRLKSTRHAGNDALETSYEYNIRSWTKSISNSLYSQNLTYTLNGNIGTQNWVQDGKNRSYAFTYDALSRLIEAEYAGDGDFSTAYSYDKHGNMLTLSRKGVLANGRVTETDNLLMTYDGNRLTSVTEHADEILEADFPHFNSYYSGTGAQFEYNRNGAQIFDGHPGKTVAYNNLNLPRKIDIVNEHVYAQNLYTYSSTGVKLRTVHRRDPDWQQSPVIGTTPTEGLLETVKTTEYIANKVYEDGNLVRILIDNGYYDNIDKKYYFYIKDHLGNNRVVADAAAEVVQSNQYYPFGLSYANGIGSGKQPYKYSGKEQDNWNGLNMYDFEARWLNTVIPMFTTQDPLSEKYYEWSPYAYCANNPMRYIDPTGMEPRAGDSESFWQAIYRAFNQMMEGVVYSIGLHPAQANSGDPKVREDASQRRTNTLEALHTANETLLSAVPGGTIAYKAVKDREITKEDAAYTAAEILPVGKVGKLGGAVSNIPEIGRKLDYIFGKATGRLHNIERSTTMQRQLNSIGIFDNEAGRYYLRGELGKTLNSSNNIVKIDGAYTIRESLLMGPYGGLLMETRWHGNKLNTVILIGK